MRVNNSLHHVAIEVLSVKIVLIIFLLCLDWNMNFQFLPLHLESCLSAKISQFFFMASCRLIGNFMKSPWREFSSCTNSWQHSIAVDFETPIITAHVR